MLNRKIGPAIQNISIQKLPEIERYTLDNDLRISEINMGTQEIIKIELFFDAGRYFETTKLSSRLCAQLIKEGTLHKSSREIAEEIEYVGASLRTYANLDHASISLISLPKHLDRVLHLLVEMLSEPLFPKDEFEKTVRTNQQSLKYELAKSDVQAYRILTEQIFGEHHPYGYNSTPELYDTAHLIDVKKHFESTFHINQAKMIVSGKISSKTRKLIQQQFSRLNSVSPKVKANHELTGSPFGQKKVEVSNHVQMSYRMGFLLFNRKHKDYPLMYLFNTILGGYFGSRLMKNIREDKGYTYNIYSSLDLMNASGYFYVSAETSPDLIDKMRHEIFLEIERLKTDLVSDQEFNMVKNYLFGSLLNYLDGPFNVAKTWKNLWLSDLSLDDFRFFLNQIQSANQQDIQLIAQQYFDKERTYEVICE